MELGGRGRIGDTNEIEKRTNVIANLEPGEGSRMRM